jgi:hypothetical protein
MQGGCQRRCQARQQRPQLLVSNLVVAAVAASGRDERVARVLQKCPAPERLGRDVMVEGLSRYQRTRCYRLGWTFERSGWAAMAIVVAGATAGLFGNGSLSSAEVNAGETLAARYARFGRAGSPLELSVEWTPQPGGEAALWIARAYLDQFAVEEVRPVPASTAFDRERIYYTFRAIRADDRIHVAFRLRPEHSGRMVGTLGVEAGAAVELNQLIFP